MTGPETAKFSTLGEADIPPEPGFTGNLTANKYLAVLDSDPSGDLIPFEEFYLGQLTCNSPAPILIADPLAGSVAPDDLLPGNAAYLSNGVYNVGEGLICGQ